MEPLAILLAVCLFLGATSAASVKWKYFVWMNAKDPNKGLKVPTTWPKFTTSGHQFLEINAKMNKDNVRQKMRMRFVHFWTSVLPRLQSVKMYE
ncbi:unnamed protein product [Boreogadus saida]